MDIFTEKDVECHLDDWLPTVRRAVDWNGWTAEDVLVGHLKGRDLQKWNLLPEQEYMSQQHEHFEADWIPAVK